MDIERKMDVLYKHFNIIICAIVTAGITFTALEPVFCEDIIEREHQIVLEKKPDTIVSAGFWIPTNQQTDEALAAVSRYITKLSKLKNEEMAVTTQNRIAPNKRQITRIRDLLWKYRVQYMGINFDSRKVVYCNFFMYDRKKHAKWKKEYVDVSKGGSAFWQIDYDVNSKQCTDLTINSGTLKENVERIIQ
ncbi:MAG: hypothetical protein LHV68_08535 [Elusimicrobia bacterium]|nr:hypothetical protein [Candidatus Liberimonas magnetica]